MRRPPRPRAQECRKRLSGACLFCGEAEYATLDAHRIVPGSEYSLHSAIAACSNCHRKIHAGLIIVHARRLSTAGYVIHCTVDGREMFLPE